MIEVEGVERGECLCRGGNRCQTEGNNEQGRDESRFAHNFSERFRRNEEGGFTLAWNAARHYAECETRVSICRVVQCGLRRDKDDFLGPSTLDHRPQTSHPRPQTS